MNDAIKGIVAAFVGFIALIAFFVLNPLVIVDEGRRGVVLEWNNATGQVLDPGIHWIVPIKDSVVEMDVTKQKDETSESTASKDQQIVHTKIAINYHLDPAKVDRIYTEMRRDYANTVITPTVSEYVKKATAKFNAEELITKRQEVKSILTNDIRKSLAKDHIIVDDVFFTNFEFSKGFNRAIEQKVIAEQSALEAKNKLEQVKYEADQKVEQAKADAEAIRIQAQAITQQGGKDYVHLQWVKAWEKGGAQVPKFITGGNNPFLMQIDTN